LSDGSRILFEQLVYQHQDYLYSFIYSMVGDRDDAEDLTAKALLRAYMAFSGFKKNCSFKTWLTTVAINLVKNYRRDAKPVSSLDVETEETGYEPVSGSVTPEMEALACEQRSKIGQLVRQVPVQYRACLVLRHVNQLSYEEISDLTKLPVTTIRNRIHQGKKMLRELCLKSGMELPKEGDDD
jgi:RNA polymerase sigma-70 factor, ECF subfamily